MADDTIRAYFESRLVLLEPVFPLACHRLCEGPDFSMEFGFKSQPQPEGKTQTFKLVKTQLISQNIRDVVCFSVVELITLSLIHSSFSASGFGTLDMQTTLWETSKILYLLILPSYLCPSLPFQAQASSSSSSMLTS